MRDHNLRVCKVHDAFAPNADGARELSGAIALAREAGVDVDVCAWAIDPQIPGAGVWARYFDRATQDRQAVVEWDDLLVDDRPMARISPAVLASDRAIVWVFAHESHELRALQEAFRSDGYRMTFARLHSLIEADVGLLHCRACAYADGVVRARWSTS